MGRQRRDSGDSEESLRWFEIITCCCKWGAHCKSCATITFIYAIPIVLLLSLTVACICIGIFYWNDCPYNNRVSYWLVISSVTPYPLLVFIKAVKEKYNGMTCWRYLSFLYYAIFAAWMIMGSIWIYDIWNNASSNNCDNVVKYFSFGVTIAHWVVLAVATVPQIYIMTQACCCCTEQTIEPLKLDPFAQ